MLWQVHGFRCLSIRDRGIWVDAAMFVPDVCPGGMRADTGLKIS